jgi:hypothetical protein
MIIFPRGLIATKLGVGVLTGDGSLKSKDTAVERWDCLRPGLALVLASCVPAVSALIEVPLRTGQGPGLSVVFRGFW